jgi:WD40 repeat protein
VAFGDDQLRVWDLDAPDPATAARALSLGEKIGYDLRLMSWGDGSGVPTSGSDLVILGTDTNGRLHIRIFDANGNRAADTDEAKLPPTQAEAIRSLKLRLPGLLPPHVLIDAEKAQLIREARSIIGQTRRIGCDLAISPDGRWLAACVEESPQLWSLQAGADPGPRPLKGHTANVRQVLFSPDSRWLATACVGFKDEVRLWNLTSGDPSASAQALDGSTSWIKRLAFSPDSRWLALSGEDTTTRLWELPNSGPARLSAKLDGTGIQFLPNSRRAVLVSAGNTAVIRDLEKSQRGTSPVVLRGQERSIDRLTVSPDGHWLVTSENGGEARLWDLTAEDRATESFSEQPALAVARACRVDGGAVVDAALDPDGRWLAALVEQRSEGFVKPRKVWLFDLTTQNDPTILLDQGSHLRRMAMSPDGRWLATTTQDGILRLYQPHGPQSAKARYVLKIPNGIGSRAGLSGGASRSDSGWYLELAFSPTGGWLAATSGKDEAGRYTISLWQLDDGGPSAGPHSVLTGSELGVWALSFSPDGRFLVASSRDGRPRVWEIRNKEVRFKAALRDPGPQSPYMDDTSPVFLDNRWLLTRPFVNGKPNRLWDLNAVDPSKPTTSSEAWDNTDPVVASPDRRWLSVGSRLYDMRGLPAFNPAFKTDLAQFTRAVFSDDSRWLAGSRPGPSVSDSKRVGLWDLSAPDPALSLITLRAAGIPLAFTRDGRTLLLSDLRLWTLALDDLIELARRKAGRNLSMSEWQEISPGQRYRKTFPTLPVEPGVIAGMLVVARAAKLQGDAAEASRLYEEASSWAVERNTAELRQVVCWRGSVDGFAAHVLPAGQRAVELAPASCISLDTRGLARALAGNLRGAAEDFEQVDEKNEVFNKAQKAQGGLPGPLGLFNNGQTAG